MTEEQKLIEKLRLIEALFARAGTEGEKVAAERARERIQDRLKQFEREDPPVEYRFSMQDKWSRQLLMALMRRYGIDPYRYYGQRHTTVMAKVSKRFVDETLWPEFTQLQSALTAYFDEQTKRIIEQAIHANTAEAEERPASGRELPP
jgi:hypothetical protein